MGTNCTPKHRLDVAEFDRVLVRANEAHAPERRARRARLRETEKEMLSGVRGPERAVLKGLDFSELADLPPGSRQALARALAAGETDFRRATEAAIPDDPGLRRRVREQMETAGRETAAARSVVAARHARIRDDLAAASPEALRATVAGLRPRDAEALHRHLRAGDAAGLARAAAILRTAGMTPEAAAAAVQQMSGRVIEQAARALYMDNVPPEHRAAMGQLTPDALMEVRVAQFTRTPLDDVRIEAILADVKARRPAADLDALRSAITETAATRHGRPRFREALAQKRAFLDLVPFGMKRKVLQTPLIVLPDDAFLSFVHGSGNESAVTLIVGGRPVVLMRAGADPGRLGEEGLHVLQYHDPEFRSRLGGLDEGRIARWDELTVDDQFAAYRGKVEIEIDAQERAIGRLRARAEAALWPGSRQRTLADLAQAEAALKALTGRRDELDDWSADRRNRVALGLEEKPAWLQQPARMFAKGDADDALIHRHLPEARARVRAAYYDLTRRFDDLPRTERKRLLNLLRTMKGAVEMDELVQTLALVNSGSNDPRHAHLQNLAPDAVTDAVRDHLFTRLRGGTVDDRAAALTRRIKARTFDTDKAENTRLQKLFAETIEALRHPLTGDDPEPAELTAARQAMFLALEKFPASTKNAALAEQLQLVSRMLGLEPAEGAGEGALRKHHQVQAMILEGLATNRTLMLAKDAPQASHTAYIDTVRQLLEGGVTDYPLAAQRSVFETLSRAYLAGGDAETLATIAALPRLLAEAEGVDPGRARIALMTTLEFLAHQPVNRYKEVVQKLGPLLLNAVDLRALPAGSTPAPGRISLADYNHYLQQAIKHPKFAASVIRFGSRARSREEAELGGISEQDLGRMSAAKPIATGQESFLDRHAAAPAGRGADRMWRRPGRPWPTR